MRILFLTTVIFLFLTSCGSDNSANIVSGQESTHKVIVTDIMQTTNYTYLYVKEKNADILLAVPKMNASIGETYYFDDGMLMENFVSKELSRTFDQIYFLGGVRTTLEIPKERVIDISNHNMKPVIEKKEVIVDAVSGGITIAELFANKAEYNGKTVKIKGQVSKFNPGIMNRNWIHIQDGTDNNGEFDLTVTTDAVVATGQTITVEGKIALNKDFGYGYKYDVIMETAVLK